MDVFTRLLARTGTDEPQARLSKRRSFELLLILGILSEAWRQHARALFAPGGAALADWLPLLLATALALAALKLRWRRASLAALLLLQLFAIAASFPQTANHVYLQLFLLALLVLLDASVAEEQQLALGALRWIFLVVLFCAGLQKLVHGYYFRGEYFAYYLNERSFASLLGPFLSDEELQRFGSGLARSDGSGPYRFESAPMIAISNLGYLSELGIPVLLFARRSRRFGVAAGIAFLIFTEALARELHFGALFASGLLLFLPGDANRRALPLFAALYAWMLLTSLRALPEVGFY